MIYRIFFEKRAIAICSPQDNALLDPNGVILYNIKNTDLSETIDYFIHTETISTLFITSDNVEETYKSFCAQFTEINAGGGVVTNNNGEYLIIYRNGVWDLPKGKQEIGEDITKTALREVQEECGTRNLNLGELICITNHTYHRDGNFVLKHTYWFKMSDSIKEILHPQSEEDITSARWISKDELNQYLKNTYPSILEVFNQIL